MRLYLTLSLAILLIFLASCNGRGKDPNNMEFRGYVSDENRVPLKGITGKFCLRLWFEGQTVEDAQERCQIVRTNSVGIFNIKITSNMAQQLRSLYGQSELQVIGTELFLRVDGKHFDDGSTREFVGQITNQELSPDKGSVHGWANLDFNFPRDLADEYYQN